MNFTETASDAAQAAATYTPGVLKEPKVFDSDGQYKNNENDLVDDDETKYRQLKLELDYELNEDASDAKITITLTNTTEKVAYLPKDFVPELFSFWLENEAGTVTSYGGVCYKKNECIDEYELVRVEPQSHIVYSFWLRSMFWVQPNITHNLSMEFWAFQSDPDALDVIIVYVSNKARKSIMLGAIAA